MSRGFPYFLTGHEEETLHLRRNATWFLVLGILLVAAGVMCIASPFMATLGVVAFTGAFLLCGGVVEIGSSFWSRRWGGFLLHLIGGLLYTLVGLILLEHPIESAIVYTFMLAIFFIAGGALRIVLALERRFSGWGWTLVSGVVTLILGIMIWRMPGAAFWVIGTFLGIDLLFNGWSWIMLSIALLSYPASTAPSVTTAQPHSNLV